VFGEARRDRVSALFAKHGVRAVFFGCHLAGARALLFVFAGIEEMPLRQFVVWDGLAALVTIEKSHELIDSAVRL